MRRLDAEWFDNPKSFNFVRFVNSRAQEADLIMQSTTFNVSPKLGKDKCVLCSVNVMFYVFILLFPDETTADQFYAAVANDVNADLPCPHSWLSAHLIKRIDSPVFPVLPHLPYVRS